MCKREGFWLMRLDKRGGLSHVPQFKVFCIWNPGMNTVSVRAVCGRKLSRLLINVNNAKFLIYSTTKYMC